MVGREMRDRITWPPEKPTATTPSSSGLDKNLGWIMEVVVILGIWYLLYVGD
jgi:hypothetical protein